MNYKKAIATKGYVSATKILHKRKPRQSQSHSNENFDICLNCTKSECNGNCDKIRRASNEKI